MFLTQYSAQIVIPRLILHVEAQRPSLPFDLGTEDGLDARAGRQLGEFYCAMQVVLVCQSNGRQLVALGQINDGIDRERGVEERVVAVDVQGTMTNDE
jgi:hypothetical protein